MGGKSLLAVGLLLWAGCAAWKEPWNLSEKTLADLTRPFQAQKEAEAFKAKVQKDPFPNATALNKTSVQTSAAH
ncbi:MAG TPA: hypothetical protein PLQ00_17090 [Thermoguttaceae bacterium]|nr:hypothetical protein [Thermoguttaceae bacterium]